MAKRKNIGKKKRFEVLKRDCFTCQYCGDSAPDAVLHVDHIKPVSKGGDNSILNLITSCFSCNSGKGARGLSDDAAVKKSISQLREISERREQLEMMVKWKDELSKLHNSEVYILISRVNTFLGTLFGSSLSDGGVRTMRKLMRRFTLSELIDAVDISFESYDDVEEAIAKIGGICYNRRNRPEQ